MNVGADMNLGQGTLDLRDSGSTLAMNGHSLTAGSFYLGWESTSPVTLSNPGDINVGSLYVGNGQTFNINASDTVTNFNLSGGSSALNSSVTNLFLSNGATAATTATGGVTGSINVGTGSTFNLGTDLNIGGGQVNVQDSGSTFNMNGHSLTANGLLLGWDVNSAVMLSNPGTIGLTNFFLGNDQSFNFGTSDTVANITLAGASTVTTTAAGNITATVDVQSGSTLTLGANLTLSFGLFIQDSGSTLDAQGHAITSNTLSVGSEGLSTVSVTNLGRVTVSTLDIGNSTAGSSLTLHGGDVVNQFIDLTGGSVLTVQEVNGIGLTLNYKLYLFGLTMDSTSRMDLSFTGLGWGFRWQDYQYGNWVGTIDNMIADGQINLTIPSGYTFEVVDSGGYTYIEIVAASVPEPSSLVLACLATAGVTIALPRRRRERGR